MVYQWPQARVLRTILVIAVLVIAADLGWAAYGAWVAHITSTESSSWQLVVSAVLYSVLALGGLFGGLLAVLIHPRSGSYLIEVEQEMRKVTWPDRPVVIRSTIIITIMTIILALFILGVDVVNQKLIHGVFYGLD